MATTCQKESTGYLPLPCRPHWFEVIHRSRYLTIVARVIDDSEGEYVILNGAKKARKG